MFDFPEHENNYIFSKSGDFTFFITSNKGFTRCSTYEELHKSWPYNKYTDKIPQGYDVIHLEEKLVQLEYGKVVWVNKKPNEDILFKGILLSLEREEFKFKDSKLYSVINSNEERINCVVNSNGECIPFGDDGLTENFDEALRVAVELSKNENLKPWYNPHDKKPADNGKPIHYMVCRVLDMFNWH